MKQTPQGLRARSGWGPWRAVTALTLVLALLGALLPTPPSPAAALAPEECPLLRGPVYAFELPDDPPVLPEGPNRPQFQAYCRLCHSPRLALTQPPFSEKKWGEIVHKMVAVYGAPIPPEQEPAVVAYLMAVQKAGR